jgi:hypothetical protein
MMQSGSNSSGTNSPNFLAIRDKLAHRTFEIPWMNAAPVDPVYVKYGDLHAFTAKHFPWRVSSQKLDHNGVLWKQGDRLSHAQQWCFENFGLHPYRRAFENGFFCDSVGAWEYEMGSFNFKDRTHAALFKLRWA